MGPLIYQFKKLGSFSNPLKSHFNGPSVFYICGTMAGEFAAIYSTKRLIFMSFRELFSIIAITRQNSRKTMIFLTRSIDNYWDKDTYIEQVVR